MASCFSFSKKKIMTKEQHNNYLTLNETEQLKILDELSPKNKKHIGLWLDTVEVKEDINREPYIVSPFTGLIYINKDISYITLYKWCVANFPNFENLPKPIDIIIYYANKWKQNPSINPYTNKEIRVSLDPKGEYVRLYKEFINGLVGIIFKTKRIKVLSVEECKKIKDSLPNEHTWVFSDRSKNSKYQINYDYLFVVYFIKSKTFQYDPIFQNELNIYLDIIVYNTSQFVYNNGETYNENQYTVEFLYIFKFFKNYLLNMDGSDFSIHKLEMKLCSDIYDLILYMREPKIKSKITNAVIDKVVFNMNVLKYCKAIFDNIPFQYVEDFLENPQQKNNHVFIKEILLLELIAKEKSIPEEYKYMSYCIINYIDDDEVASSNVFDTFIRIYNSIIKLYNDNKKIPIYKNYIKDLYNINKGVEPQIPVKQQQLPGDLYMYKIHLKKYTNVPEANSSNERKQKEFEEKLLDDERKLYEDEKRKQKEFNEKKSLNEIKLKEYEEKMNNEYDEKMKKYEFEKDVYDRIYEGKYSPKQSMELLSLNAYKRLKKDEPLLHVSKRKAKSESIIIPHSEYSDTEKLKAFSTISDKKKHNKRDNKSNSSSYNVADDYYKNDIDPYTQEEFSNMTPKKQKYSSDIIYKIGEQEYHYRFDTVSIYNYILKCIDICEKPNNFFNRVELTDDNLNEICNKIKHFTKKPTYNSATDIRPLLEDCNKYDNYLTFSWKEIIEEKDKEQEIIGVINVYLFISLGGILFYVLPQKVLTLPIFNSNIVKTFPNHTLGLLRDKISVGELIGSRFFPYRKNKSILNLPEFSFEMTDSAEKTLERLKKYRLKIEQM
jgi:hypothetical protein